MPRHRTVPAATAFLGMVGVFTARLIAQISVTGIALSTLAAATPLPATGKFVYSNACASPGGDFAGYRVRLSRSSRGLQATVEFNDDGPDGGDVARNLKFDPVSGALRFSFQGSVDADQYTFHGTASMEKLVGTFDVKRAGGTDTSGEQPQTLPAVKHVSRYLLPCDLRFPP